MNIIINGSHSIENILIGMDNGRQSGLTRQEAFAIVKALENFETATDSVVQINIGDLVRMVELFIKKASDIFDMDPMSDPNELIQLYQGHNPVVFGLTDGEVVVKTGYSHIPAICFSGDIFSYQIPNN